MIDHFRGYYKPPLMLDWVYSVSGSKPRLAVGNLRDAVCVTRQWLILAVLMLKRYYISAWRRYRYRLRSQRLCALSVQWMLAEVHPAAPDRRAQTGDGY